MNKKAAEPGKVRSFRFSVEVDRFIRQSGLYSGEVRRRIVEPLIEMSKDGRMSTVEIARASRKGGPKMPKGIYRITSATVPDWLYAQIRLSAIERKISIAFFIDRLLLEFYTAERKKRQKPESKKDTSLARPADSPM